MIANYKQKTQVITCRAVNYKLHGVNNIKEDHRVLDVFCKDVILVIDILTIFTITTIILARFWLAKCIYHANKMIRIYS